MQYWFMCWYSLCEGQSLKVLRKTDIKRVARTFYTLFHSRLQNLELTIELLLHLFSTF